VGKEKQEIREPVEISFGSRFMGSELIGGGTWVIYDVGEDKFCNAASYWYNEGRLVIGSAGGIYLEYIGKMFDGKFSLGEIIEGMSKVWEGEVLPMENIRRLTRNAGMGSRILRD
jgi:hypothetical protein